ncbi:hypothetical protein DFJ58DRAFT_848216 [Suillus subalutaceus]|uniref:uncharacterized protein n=1 Tax=Suillus subalutaceus TaxID=48586 RepID=UPI001B878FFA|nr:uncharacterized protein DFJ58DRAFT_848216 [Suillus subalutaceus]KAG1831445.1 hypothetical protein DFJ58DRAFT_848216 [Suillus subalutaceus]
MDARKHKKKSEADNDNHWKHKVSPSGDYYFKVKPNSEGSTAKGSNNDGVCCNACYKPRGKRYDVPMRWMDIDGLSWMIGDAGRLSARKRARNASLYSVLDLNQRRFRDYITPYEIAEFKGMREMCIPRLLGFRIIAGPLFESSTLRKMSKT